MRFNKTNINAGGFNYPIAIWSAIDQPRRVDDNNEALNILHYLPLDENISWEFAPYLHTCALPPVVTPSDYLDDMPF